MIDKFRGWGLVDSDPHYSTIFVQLGDDVVIADAEVKFTLTDINKVKCYYTKTDFGANSWGGNLDTMVDDGLFIPTPAVGWVMVEVEIISAGHTIRDIFVQGLLSDGTYGIPILFDQCLVRE